MLKSYNIWSPPFDPLSGGIRVLYGLKAWLETRGQIVYINGSPKEDFIAIYPEIVNGNPFNAKHVVRYILQKPGLMTIKGIPGPKNYPSTDHIFVYSRFFDIFNVNHDHILFLPILNTHLFRDFKRPRNGKAYFLRRKPAVSPDGFILPQSLINDQEKLAGFLNTIEVLYVYGQTVMYEIARLCGCRVVIIPSDDKFIMTKEEFKKWELCQDFNGISWGKDEGIKLDSDAFRMLYLDMVQSMNQKIINFTEITQK